MGDVVKSLLILSNLNFALIAGEIELSVGTSIHQRIIDIIVSDGLLILAQLCIHLTTCKHVWSSCCIERMVAGCHGTVQKHHNLIL